MLDEGTDIVNDRREIILIKKLAGQGQLHVKQVVKIQVFIANE